MQSLVNPFQSAPSGRAFHRELRVYAPVDLMASSRNRARVTVHHSELFTRQTPSVPLTAIPPSISLELSLGPPTPTSSKAPLLLRDASVSMIRAASPFESSEKLYSLHSQFLKALPRSALMPSQDCVK
jgi:hypothetical protein